MKLQSVVGYATATIKAFFDLAKLSILEVGGPDRVPSTPNLLRNVGTSFSWAETRGMRDWLRDVSTPNL